jgi:hypothetical protein
MEYISYQTISENVNNLNSASYLNNDEYSLFVNGYIGDVWYGLSPSDEIELGVFDYSKNLIAWETFQNDNNYVLSTYSFLNTRDYAEEYTYKTLSPEFVIHENEKILVSPPHELTSSFGISDGSYILSYNFTRNMAGDKNTPLIIKDISPSRKEIKLVPVNGSPSRYDAFCRKKVLISEISPLYIKTFNKCQYSDIYNNVFANYSSEISTLKTLFFLTSDGDVITFLKNLYEDLIIYTRATIDSAGTVLISPEQLIRIQGIRTYFNNYLMSESNSILKFSDLDKIFHTFVSNAIERKFLPVGENLSKDYIKAKEFIYNFFTKHYYEPLSAILSLTYTEKYLSYLKNAINLGNGRRIPILNHGFLDERKNVGDPLTLIVKLKEEIPSDVTIRTKCWISNISLVPYIINGIIKSPGSFFTVKIGSPNFSAHLPNNNIGSNNKSYTKDDLTENANNKRELTVSKKESELNIDYTDFNNFIVFSSATLRLNVFQTKVLSINSLTASLQRLEDLGSSFLTNSGSVYPYYSQEHEVIQTNIDTVIDGFDGYESYLYRSNVFRYESGSFVSSSYISELKLSGSYYDKYNRDSLLNNTPQHIIADENNADYLVFLSMMGHYFDELYAYITSLPSEKSISQGADGTFTRTVIDYMLEAFGWTSNDIIEQANLIGNYLNSNVISGLNTMSVEERTKEIKNRILINLPKIYKSKGTLDSVNLILSCYGVPSTLLSVREYGGVNYSSENASYTQYEKLFMYQWDTSSKYNSFSAEYPDKTKTIEYKFSIPSADPYAYASEQIQWGVIPTLSTSEVSGSGASGSGIIHGGFIRERGKNLGKVFFSVGYQGHENFQIYSDEIPIFDGNVYSVMIRRNDPDENYVRASDTNIIPAKYDLYVGRNISGRNVILSTSSYMNYDVISNERFNSAGNFMVGGWFHDVNGQGYIGTMDKFMLWLNPVTDSNFQDHVNNPNSYALSGSRDAHKSLVLRMHTDYPINLKQVEPGNDLAYVVDSEDWMGKYKNANSYYGSDDIVFNHYVDQTGLAPSTDNKISYFLCYAPWSGSQELVYNTSSCQYVSQSCYPYQFKEIDYLCTYTISKYGPNKFRNEKVKHVSQEVNSRLDINERSTSDIDSSVSPDSNIVGIFVDPNDFKNKDIIRYHGNYNFMNDIGSPDYAFSDEYDNLKVLRKKYVDYLNWHSGSNPRINEMMSIYKLYFNKSIFDSLHGLSSARNNILTGVVIEPSILERPKYQNKPIITDMNSGSAEYFDITACKYYTDPNTKMVSISESPLYAEFNLDKTLLSSSYFSINSMPSNPTIDLNLSYINNPSLIFPVNYLNNGTDISDIPDKYQLGHFGSNAYLPIDVENLTGKTQFDMTQREHQSGSQKFYLVKKWNTHTIWYKNGDWNRTESPVENTYVTNSIQLYEYMLLTEEYFTSLVYTELTEDTTTSEQISYTDNTKFVHYPNTFKNNPNTTFNNIWVTQSLSPSSPVRSIYDAEIGKVYMMNGSAFEITYGYPRNHYTHKSQLFSPSRIKITGNSINFTKSKQNPTTTIGEDGLEDGTSPVQTFVVGNINLIQSDNVINQ